MPRQESGALCQLDGAFRRVLPPKGILWRASYPSNLAPAGLIAALPDAQWTAVKITQYGHGVCPTNGETCGCAVTEHPYAIVEERSLEGRSDSSRFLAAGARRALWVRTKMGELEGAMPEIRRRLASERNVIIESNSILRFLDPDLYIVVLDRRVRDFKASARELLGRADAAVVIGGYPGADSWPGIEASVLDAIPKFPAEPPDYLPTALVELVAARMRA